MKSVKSALGRVVILLLLVLSTSLGFASSPAQAGPLDDLSLVYQTAKSGGKDAFCRKAELGSTYSIRSFNGTLCAYSSTIAALSQYVCTGVADFSGSSCDQKGRSKLGGADPYTVLKAEAKGAAGTTKDLISKFVPGL